MVSVAIDIAKSAISENFSIVPRPKGVPVGAGLVSDWRHNDLFALNALRMLRLDSVQKQKPMSWHAPWPAATNERGAERDTCNDGDRTAR